MKFNIELSWSKIVALIMLIFAFILDMKLSNGGMIFMFSLPFVVLLITGKQVNDRLKLKHEV